MKGIELHYQSLDGPKSAFVFIGDDGLVTSEKGLADLVATLQQRKLGKAGGGVDAASIAAFLDFNRQCPRLEWGPIREAYRAELEAAEQAGCTNCTRADITRRYVRILYDQSRVDGDAQSASIPHTTNP